MVILVPIVLFNILALGSFTDANVTTAGTLVRPSLWHHIGLPWQASWWLLGLLLMLAGLALALWSARRWQPRAPA